MISHSCTVALAHNCENAELRQRSCKPLVLLALLFAIGSSYPLACQPLPPPTDLGTARPAGQCESAKFELQQSSVFPARFKWQRPPRFPDPGGFETQSREFTIACEDFSAEQRSGEFRIRAKSLEEAQRRLEDVRIFHDAYWRYPNIQKELIYSLVKIVIQDGQVTFEAEPHDAYDTFTFRDAVIAARVNGGGLLPALFNGGTESIIFGPTDVVEFYAKGQHVRIPRFTINAGTSEIIFYSTEAPAEVWNIPPEPRAITEQRLAQMEQLRAAEAARLAEEASRRLAQMEQLRAAEAARLAEEASRGRFLDNANGTVTDTQTGLLWAAKDNDSDISWDNAKKYCETYRGGGYSDWRMPTMAELRSLYHTMYLRMSECGYDIRAPLAITCGWVWSKETLGPGAANFDFRYGVPDARDRASARSNRALPVRGPVTQETK